MVTGTLKKGRGAAPPAILSPFKGGLNNVGEGATISDDQLSVLQNFDIDTDGTLVNRPPIENTGILPPAANAGTDIAADPAPVLPLGYYVRADGSTFLVATCANKTWIFDLASKLWTKIWDGVAADFVQYDNKIVMISETTSGGYWEEGTFTPTTTMPVGSGIVVYNERFWAFGPRGTSTSTTIYFSNITGISPATSIFTWTTATDFFVVDKGDGQYITAIVADPNALLIFRSSSTYQFTYPNSPANGSLTLLNSSVGADHRFAVTRYENFYWVLNQGFLYQFISYQFYSRNSQIVRFSKSTDLASARYVDVSVSVLGERIVVFYHGSIYAYSIRQQSWAEWVGQAVPGRILQMPSDTSGPGPREAFAWTGVNRGAASQRLLKIADSPTGTGEYDGEEMSCTARTKTFDFNLAGTFKRLLYWTIGFRSARGVSGQIVPVGVNGSSITFDDMENYSFDDFDMSTWDAPIFKVPVFQDNIVFPTAAPIQALAKAMARIRFLSAYFEVTLTTKGTAATAPVRVFTVTAYLKQHADTGEKVS